MEESKFLKIFFRSEGRRVGKVDRQMGQRLQVCGHQVRLPVNCTPTVELWVITERK